MSKPEEHNRHASPDWSMPRQIDTGGKYSVTHAGPSRKSGSDHSAIALNHMPTTQATNYKHWRPDISPKSVRTFQESQSQNKCNNTNQMQSTMITNRHQVHLQSDTAGHQMRAPRPHARSRVAQQMRTLDQNDN